MSEPVNLVTDAGWDWQPNSRSLHIVDYPPGGKALVVVAPIPDTGSPIANDFIRKTTDAIAETLDRMIVADAIAATNAAHRRKRRPTPPPSAPPALSRRRDCAIRTPNPERWVGCWPDMKALAATATS